MTEQCHGSSMSLRKGSIWRRIQTVELRQSISMPIQTFASGVGSNVFSDPSLDDME